MSVDEKVTSIETITERVEKAYAEVQGIVAAFVATEDGSTRTFEPEGVALTAIRECSHVAFLELGDAIRELETVGDVFTEPGDAPAVDADHDAVHAVAEEGTADDPGLRRRRRVEDALEAFDRRVGLVRMRSMLYRWSPRRWSRKWYERASRGWSVEDTYDFDTYLAEIIVGGVGALRESLHGYPSELGDAPDPMVAWDSILELIQRGFRHIVEDDWLLADDEEERDRIEAEQDQAKRLLVYWYGALWD